MRTICVIGSINIDLVIVADRLPREGETVLGGESRVACGGKGANQAVAAAGLGGRVQLVGCIGTDEYGRIAVENLRRNGVGVRALRSVPGATGIALIVVDKHGRNLIAVAPNANARMRVPRRQFDIAVMQLETPFALPRAKLVLLNPAPADRDRLRAGASDRRHPLRGVDLLVPNEHEAARLTGYTEPDGAAAALRRMGARQVLITLGERGVYDGGCARTTSPVIGDGRAAMHPAFRVKAIDTVGAGDTFIGALAVALSEGQCDPIRFAQAAAALKCGRRGAQNVPSRRDVNRFVSLHQ